MASTYALILLALAPVPERAKAFEALLAEHWEATLKAQPELWPEHGQHPHRPARTSHTGVTPRGSLPLSILS